MGDLGPRTSPVSGEGPGPESSLGGESGGRCTDEASVDKGCESYTCHSTTEIVMDDGCIAVQQSVDEFDADCSRPLPCKIKSVGQSTQISSFPLNDDADLVRIRNDTGKPVIAGLQMQCSSEDGLRLVEGERKLSAVESGSDVGAVYNSKEKSGQQCLSPSGIMLGCELQNTSDVASGVDGFHHEDDKYCKEFEVDVTSARLITVTGVNGGLVSLDRDKDHNQYVSSIIRQSSLPTDCSSISSSPELMDEFYCNSMPQDHKASSIKSETKLFLETCDNSSQTFQHIKNKDDSVVHVGPFVVHNILEQDPEKLCMHASVDQVGEKEANTLTYSEERDTLASTCLRENASACQVHHESEMQKTSFIQRESGDAFQGLSNFSTSSFSGKEFSSWQPFHQSNGSEACSCLHSVSEDKCDNVSATISTIHCSGAGECTHTDNGGSNELNSGMVSVVRRRNPKRAASSRKNQCMTKYGPPTKTRNSAKKGKLAVNIFSLLSCDTSKRVTKKRCCSWKRARSSVWGELENLFELFKPNDELRESRNKRSKKGGCRRSGRRQPTNQRAGMPKRTKAKLTVSKSGVLLADEGDTLSVRSQNSLHVDPLDSSHSPGSLSVHGLSKATDEFISDAGGFSEQISCHSKEMENHGFAYELHPEHGEREPGSCVTQEVSVENNVSDCLGVQSQMGQGMGVAVERPPVDPGTMLDSSALHPIVDTRKTTNECASSRNHEPSSKSESIGQHIDSESPAQENLPASVLSFSLVPRSVPLQSTSKYTYSKRGKKSGIANGKKNGIIEENKCLLSDNSFEETSQDPPSLLKDEKPSRCKSRQRKKNNFGYRKVASRRRSSKIVSEDIQKCNVLPIDNSQIAVTDLTCCQESLMSENCLDVPLSSSIRTSGLQQSVIPETLSSSSVGKCPKLCDGNKVGARKSNNSAQSRRRNVKTQKKDGKKGLMSRGKVKLKVVPDPHLEECQLDDALKAEQDDPSHYLSHKKKNLTFSKMDEPEEEITLQSNEPRDDESNSGDNHASKLSVNSLVASVNHDLPMKGLSHRSEGQVLPKRSAWVRCDDCHKWRSIPVELADIIDETNCRWTCKDNSDRDFADCKVPQEKTNAEINAELEISDASCEEDSFSEQNCKGSEMKSTASLQASWVLVKSNIFLHRGCKAQTIDEIMVCQCKPPLDGSLGCGDECLNRMLNIECVPGTCPCGNLCSNQQFQKHLYAKFKWFRCGKKGFGLKLLEDVAQGQFLIEYVGEVLDLIAYEARQREYALRGQKHFYFMTLNGNEVIDACAKGNLGRFINHSCEPNCRTEKWMVNGEVCIGLFAIRDIKKGEEVTFDYNYVRVFGAAAKRCVCGSAECRGYIGGDPSNTEKIVQGDSDEEYPEPVMIVEDCDTEQKLGGINHDTTDLMHETSIQSTGKVCKPAVFNLQTEKAWQNDHVSPSDKLALSNKEVSDLILDDKTLHDISVNGNQTSVSPLHAKSHRLSLVKRKSCSLKKSVVKGGKKSSAIPLITQSSFCRAGNFDGVEEKLNELLDPQGGISKRRDATKGYLKLLFLTASSGDNVKSETSQSTRDLSLILDVMLKTKSRTVLTDIINKNGLQMLHNIMKQNNNFNKIPILRKLLKVLEFLAVREILTPEHINNIPSHAGVESFKESMIKLTYHNDAQVYQMARNFRDKWLPRTIRRVQLSDRENGWLTSRRANSNWFLPLSSTDSPIQCGRDTDAICISQPDSDPSPPHVADAHTEDRFFCSQLASTSVSTSDMRATTSAKLRKRKSRWDQSSDLPPVQTMEGHTAKISPKVMRCAVGQRELEPRCASMSGRDAITFCDDSARHVNTIMQCAEETPPGFGPPAAASQLQERYLPRLTVSYGIPLSLVEQLGTPSTEPSKNWHHTRWAVAPGIPFHPFPPLPPFPRCESSPAPGHCLVVEECDGETRPRDSASMDFDPTSTNESAGRASRAPENVGVDQQRPPGEANCLTNGIGKKCSEPDRWNGHRYVKFGPPWPRESNSCSSRGSTRYEMSSVAVGTIQNMGRGTCLPEGVRGENVSSSFSELPHQVQ